jgi:hypothetical protein
VGALEIGDAKMDSGLSSSIRHEKPKFDVLQPLTSHQILFVIDLHLQYLMEWHNGMPLAQTVLASNYIDTLLEHYNSRLDDIKFPGQQEMEKKRSSSHYWAKRHFTAVVLRYCCIAIARLCGIAIEEIIDSQAPFYEDEDISLQTLGRDLFPLVTCTELTDLAIQIHNDIFALMPFEDSEVLDAIQRRIHLIRSMVSMMDRSLLEKDRQFYSSGIVKVVNQIQTENFEPSDVDGVFDPRIQHRVASTSPLRPLPVFDCIKAYKMISDFASGFMVVSNSMGWANDPEPNMVLVKVCSTFI